MLNAALAVIPIGFLLVLVLYPVWGVLHSGISRELEGFYLHKLYWTLWQAVLSAVVSAGLALPAAYVLHRYQFWGREFWLKLLMLPFVTPVMVAALGILAVARPLQDTAWLLIAGNVFYNLSLMLRFWYAGFERVSGNIQAAARVLGASAIHTFSRVTLPLVLPYALSGLSLVFLYCFGSFGLAFILGGQHYSTLEVEIYTLAVYQLALPEAGLLVILQLGVTGLAMGIYTLLQKNLPSGRSFSPVQRVPLFTLRSPLSTLGLVFIALGIPILITLVPLAAVVWQSVGHYSVWLKPETVQAAQNTLIFTVLATISSGTLGILTALLMWRVPRLAWLGNVPFMVSAVSVGVGFLLVYPQWAGSVWLLLGAYTLFAYPFVARSVLASLKSIPPSVLAAARVLGATPFNVFSRVMVPLTKGSLKTGLAFAAASILGEFSASLVLQRPEWTTLSTQIYTLLGKPGAAGQASALASGLLLFTFVVFWSLERIEPSELN